MLQLYNYSSIAVVLLFVILRLPEEVQTFIGLLCFAFSPLAFFLFIVVLTNLKTKEKGGPKSPDDI